MAARASIRARARLARAAVVGGSMLGAQGACSDDETAAKSAAALAESCLLASDCTEPLVCAFERCHEACKTSRDCDPGVRCIAAERGAKVCQLPDDASCVYNSQCQPGLACGVDGQCRNECVTDRDCVAGQVCVGGSCAETEELIDGKLPEELPPTSGSTCSYHSDCGAPLVCLRGQCRIECLEDRDCIPTFVCEASRCVPPSVLPPARDGGAGGSPDGGPPDASVTDSGAGGATDSGAGGATGAGDSSLVGTGGQPSPTDGGVVLGTCSADSGSSGPPSQPLRLDEATTSIDIPNVAVNGVGDGIVMWKSGGGTESALGKRYYADRGCFGSIEESGAAQFGSPAYPPALHVNAAGSALALWKNTAIVASENSGSGWAAPITVGAAVGSNWNHTLSGNAAGVAFAAWERTGAGPYRNILISRYDPTSGWAAERPLEETDFAHAFNPALAVDPSGNAIAVWDQPFVNGNLPDIVARRFDAATLSYEAPVPLDLDGTQDIRGLAEARSPKIAMDSVGNALVVWTQGGLAGSNRHVWWTRYDASTSTWATADLLENDDTGEGIQPQIAVNSSGDAIATWIHDGDGPWSLWASRYTPGSNSWSSPDRVEFRDDGSVNISPPPQVAIDPNGNAAAVWSHYDGERAHVYLSRFSPASGWSPEEVVDTAPEGNASEPRIAMDASGDALVVWIQSVPNPLNPGFNVQQAWVRHFAPLEIIDAVAP